MKKLLPLIICVLSVFGAIGQDSSTMPISIPTVEPVLLKANFILPGIEYERALGRFTTVNVNPYLDLGYSSNFVLGSAWLVQPSLNIQLRRYYNLLKRTARNKKTEGNSASFVALDLLGVGRSIIDAEDFRNYYYYGLGAVWGIQRTYRSNFNFSFQTGVAYISDGFGRESYLLRLNLRVGILLKRLSKNDQ